MNNGSRYGQIEPLPPMWYCSRSCPGPLTRSTRLPQQCPVYGRIVTVSALIASEGHLMASDMLIVRSAHEELRRWLAEVSLSIVSHV